MVKTHFLLPVTCGSSTCWHRFKACAYFDRECHFIKKRTVKWSRNGIGLSSYFVSVGQIAVVATWMMAICDRWSESYALTSLLPYLCTALTLNGVPSEVHSHTRYSWPALPLLPAGLSDMGTLFMHRMTARLTGGARPSMTSSLAASRFLKRSQWWFSYIQQLFWVPLVETFKFNPLNICPWKLIAGRNKPDALTSHLEDLSYNIAAASTP
jgi:hypothetical protein